MTNAEVQQALQALSQLGAAAGNSRAGIAAVGQSMARLRMEMQRGTGTIQGNSQALQRLMTDFDGLDRATKSSAQGQAMLAEQTKMAGQIMRDAAGQMSGALVKGGIVEAVSFFKNQVFAAAESYQQGVSGTTAALRQQQVGIQSNIDILNRLSQGLALSAEMLAMIPNPVARFGAGLTAGSAAVLEVFSKEEQARKEAYTLLGAELSATTLAYQTQLKAGNSFVDGLTELRRTSNEMRLTTGEMTNVVTKNTGQLVQFGGSVQGGVVRLKSVNNQLNELTDGSQSLREQLYRMGISYEDQSQGIIDYMTLQQQAGTLGSKSSKQLAEESAKYMTNLKAISAYTGEDAKAAQARAQAASEQLAVQAKLRKSQDPQALEKFQTMIKLMPADMQKGMQQMTAFDGTIVDKNLNILLAQSPTRKRVLEEAQADLADKTLTAADLQARQQERMKKYGKALEDEALAAGETLGAVTLATGGLGDVTGMLQNQANEGRKGQTDLKDIVGSTTEQFNNLKKQGTDPLTESIIKLDTKFREFQMPKYSSAFTESMTKMVTVGGPKTPTLEKQNEDAMKKTLEALKGLDLLSNVPSLMQSVDQLVIGSRETNTTMGGVSTNLAAASNTQLEAANKFSESVDKFGRSPSTTTGGNREDGALALLQGRSNTPSADSISVALKNPASMLENLSGKANTPAPADSEQMVSGLFNSPNLMTTTLAELKNIMTSNSEATQSLMRQHTEKMDTLIAVMEDGNGLSKQIANNIA